MQGLTGACSDEILAVCGPECQCVCVCVCVCVCEVMRVEREGVHMVEFHGQNSCRHFKPVLHRATKPSPSPPPHRQPTPYPNTQHGSDFDD